MLLYFCPDTKFIFFIIFHCWCFSHPHTYIILYIIPFIIPSEFPFPYVSHLFQGLFLSSLSLPALDVLPYYYYLKLFITSTPLTSSLLLLPIYFFSLPPCSKAIFLDLPELKSNFFQFYYYSIPFISFSGFATITKSSAYYDKTINIFPFYYIFSLNLFSMRSGLFSVQSWNLNSNVALCTVPWHK